MKVDKKAWDLALKQIENWKSDGQKIVFTNGCFDIIHAGHIFYLKEARSHGDKLVVGLNSDRSVKELKGSSRPINNQNDRKTVLEALQMVDLAIIFDDNNPLELIIKISPDMLVKGGDWKIEQIVGAKEVLNHGGQVKSLGFLSGYSSTSIIDKIEDEN